MEYQTRNIKETENRRKKRLQSYQAYIEALKQNKNKVQEVK